MTLNNDAETARCKGDRIRVCVSISELLFKKKLLWMTLMNDELRRECVSISDVFAFIDLL